MKLVTSIIFIFLFLSGCQQKPTKMVAQDSVITESVLAENLIKEKAVILDVRTPFEFNISHAPGAVNVQWDDFSQPKSAYRGLLQNDLFALARRLSLIGIDPDTKVIVVGKGHQGQGEEGRVAWTLQVLGIKNVHTLHHKSFREMNVTKEMKQIENKPYWKPQVQEALMVNLKAFKKMTAKNDGAMVLLDVRSAQEFALSGSLTRQIKVPLKNIEWKAFFAENGMPDSKIEIQLKDQGILKNTKILVISNHGVRSGAVVYALSSLGYPHVSNFAGGYNQYQ